MANRIRCDPAIGVVSRLGTAFVLTSDDIGMVPDSVPEGSAMSAGGADNPVACGVVTTIASAAIFSRLVRPAMEAV